MKALLRIYLTLASGILLTTLVLVTAFKLTTRAPIAPTAPTAQKAAEATPPPIASDLVGLAVRIQGLDSNGPTTVNATVRILSQSDPSHATDSGTLSFTKDSNGTYYTNFDPPEPQSTFLNTPVIVLIKGEKHLQRRFETTLSLGQFADLTSKMLEAGDVPLQDGQVNDSDMDYIKDKIFSSDFGADLNYDGIVNAGDLSLILDTLSTKVDEE